MKECEFSIVGDTIEIQTTLSKTMLPVIFNSDAERTLHAALEQRGEGKYKIRLLARPTGTKEPVPAVEELQQSVSISDSDSNAISAPFKKLIESAAKLNKVSDQLTSQIEEIDGALKRLNLGVSAWVTVEEEMDEDDSSWSREELGYTRIGNRWGVALKTSSGFFGDPSQTDGNFYSFSDAPRELRIRAVRQIPRLIECLSVEAENMIATLAPKVEEVAELIHTLNSLGGGVR